MNKFTLNSPIELSGLNDDKPYIELTSRLCYLDDFNANGIGLSSKSDKECFESLIDMPIVAKINKLGTKFGSHEVKKDKDGNYTFGTSAYGTHIEVWVEQDEVEIPNKGIVKLPCLFAKSKVWKRFENVVSLIVNKLENPEKYNGGLFSSWELQGGEHEIIDGKKMYTSFQFLSNCLIDVPPAYFKNSKTLQVASEENTFEQELEMALAQDMTNDDNSDNKELDNKNNNPKGGEEDMTKKKIETSTLGIKDLTRKLAEALNPKGWNGDTYFSINEIYPQDNKVMTVDIFSEMYDEVCIFPYTIDENDEVSVGEIMKKKMSDLLAEKTQVNISMNLDETAKLISAKELLLKEKELKISELKLELTNVKSEFMESTKAVTELMSEKGTLETQISELIPFKEKVEELQKIENERLLSEKKNELSTFTLEDNLISEEEITKDEKLITIFSELTLENFEQCKEKVEFIKGKKALEKFKAQKQIEKSEQVKEVETSGIKVDPVVPKINISGNDEDNLLFSAVDIVKMSLNKK